MLESEVLIGKGLGAINGSTPCTVAIQEVPTLDHEVVDLTKLLDHSSLHLSGTYHAMKFAALIALWPTLSVLGLSCTKLTEVLCRLGCDIGEELHLDSS